MHLVCHMTIPGTDYQQGNPVTDPAAIAEILANTDLAKNFSQVPDGTFPNSTPPVPPVPPVFAAKPASSVSVSASASNNAAAPTN